MKVYVWARWERLRRPSARLLAFDLAFQDACSLPSSPSSLGSDSDRVFWTPRASVIRWFAASACPSMRCAWIFSRTARAPRGHEEDRNRREDRRDGDR